jgi:uncharacterized pyridoxamine 5'-phosphate oxidase family protein
MMTNKRKALRIMGCAFIIWLSVTGCTKPNGVPQKDLETGNLGDFVHILEKYRNGVLANRNGENLRTQIITFSFAEGNRVFFCTTSDKPMYTQLVKFPYVSYCTYPEDFEPVLSINGKVVFIEDKALKERALESNYYAKQNFKSADNPLLRVFCIEAREIETYSSDGVKIYAVR